MEQNFFRELARTLSRLQGGRFAGAVIMRADWQLVEDESAAPAGWQVLKDRHGLFQVRCTAGTEALEVTMLLGCYQKELPDKSNSTSQLTGQTDLSIWQVEPAAVQAFTEAVGDTNWIHQGEQPVIPGLLLMEKLLGERPAGKKLLSLRFYHAMTAGTVLVDWSAGKFFQQEQMTAAFRWQ